MKKTYEVVIERMGNLEPIATPFKTKTEAKKFFDERAEKIFGKYAIVEESSEYVGGYVSCTDLGQHGLIELYQLKGIEDKATGEIELEYEGSGM